MKAMTGGLFKPFAGRQINAEVEEELSFHLDLLTRALLEKGMSAEQADAAARERFGNVEQIKKQCVEISGRNTPLKRILKSFLILVFLAGVFIRVFSPEFHFTRIGDILMAVGILGRVLLYVRSLRPSSFLSNESLSPLILNEKPGTSFAAYDQRKRTPVERVIFDR